MSITGIQRILAVHGAPRSGTSWLGQLFNSSEHVAYRYQPMFSHAFKSRLNAHSSTSEISAFFNELLCTEDDFVLQRGSASLAGYDLVFRKEAITHLVYKEVRYHELIAHILDLEPTFAAIGLIRNPCAVIHSWINAPREFDHTWSLGGEWRHAPHKNGSHPENWYGFERWKELALLFHRLQERHPSRFHIIRYEDLAAAPEQTLRLLFNLHDLPWTAQTDEFLRQTRSRDDGSVYGVFRNASTLVKDWRGQLDENIAATIHDELEGGPLSRYLLPHSSEIMSILEKQ